MQYQVFVQSQADNQFIASVLGIPNCVALGRTKEEAIAKAKTTLAEKLAHGELVTIDIDSQSVSQDHDPWLKHMGIFANDPTFEDFLEEVAAYRQQVDKEAEA